MCKVYRVTYKIKLFDLFSKSLKTEETEKLTNLLAGIATKKTRLRKLVKIREKCDRLELHEISTNARQ